MFNLLCCSEQNSMFFPMLFTETSQTMINLLPVTFFSWHSLLLHLTSLHLASSQKPNKPKFIKQAIKSTFFPWHSFLFHLTSSHSASSQKPNKPKFIKQPREPTSLAEWRKTKKLTYNKIPKLPHQKAIPTLFPRPRIQPPYPLPSKKKDSCFHNITKGLCPGGSPKRERKGKRGESVSTKRERKSKGRKSRERGKVKVKRGNQWMCWGTTIALFFFQVPALSIQVAEGAREENWEGGAGLWGLALLPLESLIFVLLLCAQREEVKELENRRGIREHGNYRTDRKLRGIKEQNREEVKHRSLKTWITPQPLKKRDCCHNYCFILLYL